MAAPASAQFLAPVSRPEDEELEQSLRPRRLDEFVGQERVKEQLQIALQAARARGQERDPELLLHALLADELAEAARPQGLLELVLIRPGGGRQELRAHRDGPFLPASRTARAEERLTPPP